MFEDLNPDNEKTIYPHFTCLLGNLLEYSRAILLIQTELKIDFRFLINVVSHLYSDDTQIGQSLFSAVKDTILQLGNTEYNLV